MPRVCLGSVARHGVEPVAPLEELGEDADEVTAYRAADAAVVHLEDVLGCLIPLLDERVVNANVAKLILDHRDSLAVVGCQNVVEQGGFAGAQIARENGDGDSRVGHCSGCP